MVKTQTRGKISKVRRQEGAAKRQVMYNDMTVNDKLAAISQRPGESAKEFERLLAKGVK